VDQAHHVQVGVHTQRPLSISLAGKVEWMQKQGHSVLLVSSLEDGIATEIHQPCANSAATAVEGVVPASMRTGLQFCQHGSDGQGSCELARI